MVVLATRCKEIRILDLKSNQRAVWKDYSGLRRGDEFDSMGGTEAFPDLGKHCSEELCHQLDFLPFKCDACSKVLLSISLPLKLILFFLRNWVGDCLARF